MPQVGSVSLTRYMDQFLANPPFISGEFDGAAEDSPPPSRRKPRSRKVRSKRQSRPDQGPGQPQFRLGDDSSTSQVEERRLVKRTDTAKELSSNDGNVPMMLAALLQILCGLGDDRPSNQRALFGVMGKALVDAGLLPPSVLADEVSVLRDRFALAVSELFSRARETAVSDSNVPPSLVYRIQSPLLKNSPSRELRFGLSGDSLRAFQNGRLGEGLFPSRYRSDFRELCRLGSGGFGHVFKAECKLDGCQYAVKKIRFDIRDSRLCFRVCKIEGHPHQQRCAVLREVKVLARLCHTNVVRYHAAWLEYEEGATATPSTTAQSTAHQPYIRELSDESNTHTGSGLRRNLSSPLISFHQSGDQATNPTPPPPNSRQGSTAGSKVSSASSGGFFRAPRSGPRSDSSAFSHQESSEASKERRLVPAGDIADKLRRMLPVASSLVLYVQMELCSHTLRDYITRRNGALLTDGKDEYSVVDRALNEKILRELLASLDHIHSKGLIHRDIKPGNIFLRLPSQDVVLGDFGLATVLDDDGLANSPMEPGPSTSSSQRLSSGVGTWTYSAPEQLTSNSYDAKVDMFSVGMIAYELYRPYRTSSERFASRLDLRSGSLEPDFATKWPLEGPTRLSLSRRRGVEEWRARRCIPSGSNTTSPVKCMMLRSLPLGDYIFGTNERARYEVLNRQMTAEISELNLLPPLRERENPTPQAPNHLTLPPIMPGALDTAPEYPPSPHPSTATMRNPLLAQACDDADSLPSTNSV